tara:strand:+ start:218 stop:475 length:258 start_codon:yes stop_codon:yes gene_type:complete
LVTLVVEGLDAARVVAPEKEPWAPVFVDLRYILPFDLFGPVDITLGRKLTQSRAIARFPFIEFRTRTGINEINDKRHEYQVGESD